MYWNIVRSQSVLWRTHALLIVIFDLPALIIAQVNSPVQHIQLIQLHTHTNY